MKRSDQVRSVFEKSFSMTMVLAADLVMIVAFAGCSSPQGAIPGTMTLDELRMQIVLSMVQGDHEVSPRGDTALCHSPDGGCLRSAFPA